MKILVTGSQGFIGRNLVEELELDGHEVSKWDLHGRNELGQPAFRNFKDITKETLEDIDRVVHLAALADVRKSFDNPDKWFVSNVHWSTNLFQLCSKLKIPMVYASSSSVHNWSQNPYAGSKKAMEAVALATGKHIGLRFTNVYGDGCRSTMLTQKMINEIPFPTPLNVICSPNHIKKVVPATNEIVVITLNDIPGSITKLPAFSKPTDTPYPCKAAIITVPYLVICVIFLRPISPCSFKLLK